MFVYYFVQVEQPFETVEPRLRSFFSRFHSWAEAAYRDGEELRATISVGSSPGTRMAKTVRLQVGDPETRATETRIPVIWEATGPTGMFPRMEGTLIAAPLGPDYTQVAFRGSYEPPLGVVGRALDKVIMHRLAESSVKGFVDRIGGALNHI